MAIANRRTKRKVRKLEFARRKQIFTDVPMLTPLAKITKSKVKKCVKRARGANEAKIEPGCGDALWTPLTHLAADSHVAEISGPSSSSSVMPVAAELPRDSTILIPDTLVSDRVTEGAFERMVDMLEGQPVSEEVHGTPGAAGYYKRVSVTCPVHSERGMPLCRIRRSVGAKQIATLGVHEPLAFIGAWLADASRFATRSDHMAFKPSAAQTRAYAERERLI